MVETEKTSGCPPSLNRGREQMESGLAAAQFDIVQEPGVMTGAREGCEGEQAVLYLYVPACTFPLSMLHCTCLPLLSTLLFSRRSQGHLLPSFLLPHVSCCQPTSICAFGAVFRMCIVAANLMGRGGQHAELLAALHHLSWTRFCWQILSKWGLDA